MRTSKSLAVVMIPADSGLGTRSKSEFLIPLSRLSNREVDQLIIFNRLDAETDSALLQDAVRRGLFRKYIPIFRGRTAAIKYACLAITRRASVDPELFAEAQRIISVITSIPPWDDPDRIESSPLRSVLNDLGRYQARREVRAADLERRAAAGEVLGPNNQRALQTFRAEKARAEEARRPQSSQDGVIEPPARKVEGPFGNTPAFRNRAERLAYIRARIAQPKTEK